MILSYDEIIETISGIIAYNIVEKYKIYISKYTKILYLSSIYWALRYMLGKILKRHIISVFFNWLFHSPKKLF